MGDTPGFPAYVPGDYMGQQVYDIVGVEFDGDSVEMIGLCEADPLGRPGKRVPGYQWRKDRKPITTYDLFIQDAWWRRADGGWVPIANIDSRYASNLIAFLERRARRLHVQVGIDSCYIPGPNGDMASLAWEGELADLWDQDPLEWLRDSKLYKAIAARITDTDGGIPPPIARPRPRSTT